MNKKQLDQKGVLHFGGMLMLLAVVAVIGFAGAKVIQNSKAGNSGAPANGLAILNSNGDTWSKQTGVAKNFFWPEGSNCERKENQVSIMYGGVFGNNGKQVYYLLGRTVNGNPKLLLCKSPIDKPQNAEVAAPLADSLMTTYEESGYEYLKNPIVTTDNKIIFEQRLQGETKSTYRLYNPSNDNLKDLANFGQSIGYQWKAASDVKVITYKSVYPYNKCVYDISNSQAECVQTSLPKETVQVFMPRSNNYIVYLTNVDGVGKLYKADLNGGNKKLLRENIKAPRILALSPSETKLLFNENYTLKQLTLKDSTVERVTDNAQSFAVWQPIPPAVTP
jgi:hypothetical protein